MRLRWTTSCLLVLGTTGSAASAAPAPGDCAALSKLTLPAVTITLAAPVPAGQFSPPSARPVGDVPAFCRVAGVIKPTPDSDIRFEVWMPASGWNGRFMGVGNGGFAGEIFYQHMALALRGKYATAGTDTGHQSSIATDASWALGHPEKVVDFGHRAIHQTAVAAKALIRAFYDEPPAHSYFSACSNGGRQGLMEAQRYPGDYDGIIAGAPANYWTRLLASGTSDVKLLLEKDNYIPSEKLGAIQAAALAACDSLDGVKDGTIENPASCKPDVAVLRCGGVESPSCLTQPQAATLQRIYEGPRTAAGRPFFPGYPPGGEAEPGGWGQWITGKSATQSAFYAFGTQFFRYMVFGDPAWDLRGFDLERDAKAADEKLGPILNAIDPDLGRFKARGGKLILYHGWSDAAIPAGNTIDYHQSVVAKMGRAETDGFVRLFLVPGMQHCSGGSGATWFGQWGPSSGSPDSDVVAALERWVEKGIAPERVIAVKRKTGDPSSEVVRSRPLCWHPLVARYKGSGSTDDAANFVCGAER